MPVEPPERCQDEGRRKISMEWVRRFLKSGLGGDPRDSVRALESMRGCRMQEHEADAWIAVLEATPKEDETRC